MQGNTLSLHLDYTFHAVDSTFQVLDSGLFVSGTWIPDSNHLWGSDSLSCILDRVQNSFIIHKQKAKEINV